jgi:hypothetical protein
MIGFLNYLRKNYFKILLKTWFGSRNSPFMWLFFMGPMSLLLFHEDHNFWWGVGMCPLMFLLLPFSVSIAAYRDSRADEQIEQGK